MKRLKRVALMFPVVLTQQAQQLRGVTDYAAQCGTWMLDRNPELSAVSLRTLVGWSGDGVVASLETVAEAAGSENARRAGGQPVGRLAPCRVPPRDGRPASGGPPGRRASAGSRVPQNGLLWTARRMVLATARAGLCRANQAGRRRLLGARSAAPASASPILGIAGWNCSKSGSRRWNAPWA